MNVKTGAFLIPSLLAACLIVFHACTYNDQPTDPNLDKALFAEISSTQGGYVYYAGGSVLTPAVPSPHGSFKLRLNATAAAALDGTGELPVGGSFPTGSILVKEVQSGGSLSLYAVIKKDPSSPNAGSGWVWAEINPDGSPVFSTINKGSNCVSCHSETPNRDHSRTFDFH